MVFLYLVARGWEKVQISWRLNFFFGRKGARPFTSIEPSMMNHLNSRIVEGKIICFTCVC